MTTTTTPGGVAPDLTETNLVRTARTTGLFYLAFFITGILGSLVVRGQLFAADDAQATLTNLLDNEWLARVGIALELSIVLTQALTAVWFYRLFNSIDRLAAGSLTAFGLVNAVAILTSAALLATALDAATDASLTIAGGQAAMVQLLYVVSGHLWGVAALFFGLWLLPMGWLVLRSRWLPRALGLDTHRRRPGLHDQRLRHLPLPERRTGQPAAHRSLDRRRGLDHRLPDHLRHPPPHLGSRPGDGFVTPRTGLRMSAAKGGRS